ncbi:MAG: MOSC domain-containing protein [Myxococcales bacterium]|nr:MOSC domain-containing protein [Myxococcales bacterium]
MSVHRSATHSFSKNDAEQIHLLAGLGVEGDVHSGARVRHRSRVAVDATRPNLRQVHLLHIELLQELASAGHEVSPGQLGENVTTAGLSLVDLPTGAILRLGETALVAITGLRNPCGQIDDFQPGLLRKVSFRDDQGRLVRKAGVMGVVIAGGIVHPGDSIEVALPPGPAIALERV